ncbi:MAG TPA: methyltransferase domain-containing protein [Xanthobacteraceae bacterium]|nr:methyltransferase domain-containing protein [Xanthobacteraceae bacterium]
MIASWREFWDRPHRIYVNDRHRQVHYERVAADIIGEIPDAQAAVLDYGCGEAVEAETVAARCKRLLLCESAVNLRGTLKARYAARPEISVIAPEEIDRLADGSVDLVVANSVLQYLTREECADLATRLRPKLSRGGRLIFADVVPPGGGVVADVSSLLSSAARHGFFFAALGGLAFTLVSDYRRLRQQIGLTTYEESEILALLERAGYRARRRPKNFGFNQRRMTVIAEPG